MSYNHTTYRVRKLRPELTHLQCMGPGLTRRRGEVADLVPESLIHLEGFRTAHGRDWVSMLFLRYDGPDVLYRQMKELADVEVYVDDPHTWVLHHLRLDGVREAARKFDPDGLLNPGKLLMTPVDESPGDPDHDPPRAGPPGDLGASRAAPVLVRGLLLGRCRRRARRPHRPRDEACAVARSTRTVRSVPLLIFARTATRRCPRAGSRTATWSAPTTGGNGTPPGGPSGYRSFPTPRIRRRAA